MSFNKIHVRLRLRFGLPGIAAAHSQGKCAQYALQFPCSLHMGSWTLMLARMDQQRLRVMCMHLAGSLPQYRAGHGAELLGAPRQGGPLQPAEYIQGAAGGLRMHQAKAWRPGEGNLASILGQFSAQQLSWMPGALHVRIDLLRRGKASPIVVADCSSHWT